MDEARQTKKPLYRRIMKGLLSAVLTLLLAVVFYVAVVLGEPQNVEQVVSPRMDQPLLQAMPAVTVTGEEQLATLIREFPAPVMRLMSGSGLTLTAGQRYDAAFENGYGRIVTLIYEDGAGTVLTVESIYPARALSLMGRRDYHLSGTTGQSLAGLRSVRMENAEHIRLHAQGEEAIYVVTAPKAAADRLIALTRSLQLFSGE